MDDCFDFTEVGLGIHTMVNIKKNILLRAHWWLRWSFNWGRKEGGERGEERGEKRNLWIQDSKYLDTVGRVYEKGKIE